MEKIREKNTAWKALFGDFLGMEQKDEENDDYKTWESENFSEIKKSDNSIKGLEKMFEHVSKTSRKRKVKESKNIDDIKSPKVQHEKTKTRNEQKGGREI